MMKEFTSRLSYPNPFGPTGVEFDLPEDGYVTLTVFDGEGNELATLINNEWRTAGTHVVDFTQRGYNHGAYFYRLRVTIGAKDFIDTKRIVVGG